GPVAQRPLPPGEGRTAKLQRSGRVRARLLKRSGVRALTRALRFAPCFALSRWERARWATVPFSRSTFCRRCAASDDHGTQSLKTSEKKLTRLRRGRGRTVQLGATSRRGSEGNQWLRKAQQVSQGGSFYLPAAPLSQPAAVSGKFA